MSKLSSFPPFSPAKGASVPADPAFEFDAPRYCDLQSDKYDFYEDYEKNLWFEETHWLHEPPEKRPLSNRTKRKSVLPNNLAAAAAAAKRQLTALMGDGSPDMAKLRNCVTTTRGDDEANAGGAPQTQEEERGGRSGSFERDANFSPSKVFAPISENIESDALKRARFAAANSPMKLRGPERILFRSDSNKENVLNFENEELEEPAKIVKGRKSTVPSSRISDGKPTEGESKTASIGSRASRTSAGASEKKEEKKEAKKEEREEEKKEEKKEEKAKASLEGKVVTSRISGGDVKEGKGTSEEGEQKRKSSGVKAEVKTRKSGDGGIAEKARRKSTVMRIVEEKSGRNSGGNNLKTSKEVEEKSGRNSGGNSLRGTKKEETEKEVKKRKDEMRGREDEKTKTRARKSISVAFINSNSTTYNIPTKNPPPPSSLPSSSSLLPSSSLPSSFLPSHPLPPSHISLSISSTLPFLDVAKSVTSLPTRVSADEIEENEVEEEETNTEALKQILEGGEGGERGEKGEKGRKKRKSGDAFASEKPKRTRSSIMTCPVPSKTLQKKPVPQIVEKPPASKEKKVIRTKRKSFEFELDDDVAQLLEKHNKKFKPVAAYVPRNFSTKDVKMWEEYSGKKWYSLSASEREEANEWIKNTKKQMSG